MNDKKKDIFRFLFKIRIIQVFGLYAVSIINLFRMEQKWSKRKVQKDMNRLVKEGAFGQPISWNDMFTTEENPKPEPKAVRAVLWNSEEEPPNPPYTWKEWFVKGAELMELVEIARDQNFTPKWEMIAFRKEKDFYAGIFSDFLQLWLPIIKELPNARSRAYSVLSRGVDVFENLKQIRFEEPITFRKRLKIATKEKTNISTVNTLMVQDIRAREKVSMRLLIDSIPRSVMSSLVTLGPIGTPSEVAWSVTLA